MGRRHINGRWTAAVFALLAGHPGQELLSQRPPVVEVVTRLDSLTRPLASVTGLRVLSATSLIVADELESRLLTVDFPRRVRSIGRQGNGPGEYRSPGVLYHGPGGSTFMVDQDGRRILRIDPRGRIDSRSIPFSRKGARVWGLPIGGDTTGRFLVGLRNAMADSLEQLVRVDPVTGQLDTLAALFSPLEFGLRGIVIAGASAEPNPYPPADGVAAAPNGRIAVVRADGYRVEWIDTNGSVVKGPPLSVGRVPVTARERTAWAEAYAQRGQIRITDRRGRTEKLPAPDVSDVKFPSVLPLFQATGVIAGDDGRVYVPRSVPVAQARAVIDVFDARGIPVVTLSLPPQRRLLAVAHGLLFLARRDDDDLLWLERWTPPFLPGAG